MARRARSLLGAGQAPKIGQATKLDKPAETLALLHLIAQAHCV
jgi:hypothetical protein